MRTTSMSDTQCSTNEKNSDYHKIGGFAFYLLPAKIF